MPDTEPSRQPLRSIHEHRLTPYEASREPDRGRPRRCRVHRRRGAALRLDAGAQPARWRPAPRVQGRGVLLGPRRGTRDTGPRRSTRRRASISIEGLPTQTWYHWGELWLGGCRHHDLRHGAAGCPPFRRPAPPAAGGRGADRHDRPADDRVGVARGLPVRVPRLPVPRARAVVSGRSSALAVGMIFGITSYGVAAVAVLLALYGLAVLGVGSATWALAVFAGSAAALIVPAHIVIALLASSGSGASGRSRSGSRSSPRDGCRSSRRYGDGHSSRPASPLAPRSSGGLLTGHGVGGSGASPSVPPFNAFWRETVAIIVVCGGRVPGHRGRLVHGPQGGSIEAGPVPRHGGDRRRRRARLGRPPRRLQHVPPVLRRDRRLRDAGRGRRGVEDLAALARNRGTANRDRARRAVRRATRSRRRLRHRPIAGLSGPGDHLPVPVAILARSEDLPPDAKLAYACRPRKKPPSGMRNAGPRRPHRAARRADVLPGRDIRPDDRHADLAGRRESAVPCGSAARALPDVASAHRPPADVASFLKANGIDYIYVDTVHPNSLVPDAVPVATSGETQVLRFPDHRVAVTSEPVASGMEPPADGCRRSQLSRHHARRWLGLAVDRPGAAVRRRLPPVRHLDRPLRRAARAPTHRPARRSGSGSRRDCWCWPPGGRRRVGRSQLVHPGRGRLRHRHRVGRACGDGESRRCRRQCDRRSRDRRSDDPATASRAPPDLIVAILGGAVFVVAVALLYGSTLSPARAMASSRSSSTMGRITRSSGADLAKTGTETIYSPAGFDQHRRAADPDLVPLGRAVAGRGSHLGLRDGATGCPPLRRPAASAPGGGGADRDDRPADDRVLIAWRVPLRLPRLPLPGPDTLLPGPFFSSFARGLIFGITAYGLAAVAVLLAMYGLTVARPTTGEMGAGRLCRHRRGADLAGPCRDRAAGAGRGRGCLGGSDRPSRSSPIVACRSCRAGMAPRVHRDRRRARQPRSLGGLMTGHSAVTGGATPGVTPFSASWRDSVAIIAIGAGAFLAIPIAWWMARRGTSIEADLYLGTGALVVVGAIVWGALLGRYLQRPRFLCRDRRLRDAGRRRRGLVDLRCDCA